MKLRIEIDLDNDAFAGRKLAREVEKILDLLPSDLDGVGRRQLATFSKTLMDSNGNSVGKAVVVDDEVTPRCAKCTTKLTESTPTMTVCSNDTARSLRVEIGDVVCKACYDRA